MSDLFIEIPTARRSPLLLKCEGMNFAGSIKLKTAVALFDQGEALGLLTAGTTVVESSSGNLGVAMSVVAASRGYGFVCVTDARCNDTSRRLMEALGATVEIILEPTGTGGLLEARLNRVTSLVEARPDHVWLNQYTNPANPNAHFRTTAEEILHSVGAVSVLFLGIGTAGTAMGCAKYFRLHSPDTVVVAVDSSGSVSLGGPPAVRHIPGLGASVVPPQLDLSYFDDVVSIDETDTIAACRDMLKQGFVFGGSTGTVLAAARQWLADNEPSGPGHAVAISADNGERYLETIYNDDWTGIHFPDSLLELRSLNTVEVVA